MKKLLSLVLVLVLTFSLAACATTAPATSTAPSASPSSAAPASETPSAAPATTWPSGRTIGMNQFVAGDYLFSIMGKCTEVLTDKTGDELSVLSDNADINQLLNDVDNMINSGVDGALWWGILDPNYAVGPQKYEDAKIPFAFFDAVPGQQDLRDNIANMQYFAGAASCNNDLLGEQMATQALADGCKTALVFANVIGSHVADRADKFKAVFEAGGGKVVEISHVATTANAHIEATQNLLATYPDIDCIYAVTIDYALGAYSVTSQMKDRTIKMYSNDITPDSLKYLQNGQLQGLNGGHWIDSYLAAALLINTMDGHRIVDSNGKPLYLLVDPVVATPKTADLYQKCFIDQLPFSYDDLSYLLYRNNPNVTAQDYIDFAKNYSIENVLRNKMKQGVITADELKAAGINP